MELLKAYLKERRLTLTAFLLFVGVFAVSFALYGLPLAAVGYPAGLCVLLAGAALRRGTYGRAARRHKALKRLRAGGRGGAAGPAGHDDRGGGGLRRRGGHAAAGAVAAGDGARRPVART